MLIVVGADAKTHRSVASSMVTRVISLTPDPRDILTIAVIQRIGATLIELRNRMGTSTLSSLAEIKMHIRGEHQERSTKIGMKRLFGHRSKTTSSATA